MSYILENPCHPGSFVRRNIVEPRNLTIMGAAALLGVTRQSLSDFLNEKSGLSADMALRIEKAFGLNMETLMGMQNHYDIAKIRRRERSNQNTFATKTKSQPAKRGFNLRLVG